MIKYILGLFLVVACGISQAANVYIRDGGTGSGAAWNDALDDLPASLTRGNTYYVADGTYGTYVFDDDASGTTTITIKKCTAGDHGTETGYVSTYCDGQATFGELQFTRPYYIIDGATRNESNWFDYASYGIESAAVRASRLDGGHVGSDCSADNLTFQYIHVGTDTTSFATNSGGRSFYIGGFGGGSVACQNWTIARNLVQNTYEVQCVGGEGIIIEYNAFYIGWAKEAIRGQTHCKDITVRYNLFRDSCQKDPDDPTSGCTAEIAAWDGPANSMDNWTIHGNVFWKTTSEANSGGVIIVGDSGWGGAIGPVTNNSVAYNNTIYGITDIGSGTNVIRLDGGSGNVVRNNLAYNTDGTAGFSPDTSNNVDASSDPFVNAAGNDFHLDAATAAGFTLSSPYDVDLDGETRGADGTWDVGAYEYLSATVPNAPTNFRLILTKLILLLQTLA